MRLQSLATASLLTAVATVALVLGAAVLTWQTTNRNVETVERLIEVRDGAYRIDVAIRYLNHLHIEPDILRGLVVQAVQLQEMLEDETHRQVVSARLHLSEIEALAKNALAGIRNPPGFDARNEDRRLRPVIEQMRIHESGALEAVHAVIDDRNREIASGVQRSLVLLLVSVLAVLVLGYVVFWLVFFRIRRPLGAFRSAAARFGAGDSSARIALDGKDELGDVAGLFNRAMAQRESFQRMLQERIKETLARTAAA